MVRLVNELNSISPIAIVIIIMVMTILANPTMQRLEEWILFVYNSVFLEFFCIITIPVKTFCQKIEKEHFF